MTREEKQRIVSETLSRFETDFRDPAKVLEHTHEDVLWWIAGSSVMAGTRTRGEMVEMLEGLPAFTDSGMRLTPTGFVIDGDKAAVEGVSLIRMKDGREYRNQYHWLFEFRGDKIARVKEYLDTEYVTKFFELD